jgi:hypothetical protein
MIVLLDVEKAVELLQIRQLHDDLRRGRKLRTSLRQRDRR